MLWRLLLLLVKPAALTLLFELLSPLADAIGLHVGFIQNISWATSQAIRLPARECEVMVVFALCTLALRLSKIAWDLATL